MVNKYFQNKGKAISSAAKNRTRGSVVKPKGPKTEGVKKKNTTKKTGPDPLKLANPKKKTETKKTENKSKQSFGEAFKAARKAGVKEFEYNGKKYAAVTKDEVKKAGFKDGKKDLGKFLNMDKGKKYRSSR
tara:strand:+ start:461 stop:853 length:393 start_codon:yes stop_codon:yes gene_type:complete